MIMKARTPILHPKCTLGNEYIPLENNFTEVRVVVMNR